MQRILVIGCPGSGKSTFSRALHERVGYPLIHLDRLYWNADRTTVDPTVFYERLAAAMAQDVWIIDGNYASTMACRMQACDTVIWLDYDVEVCLSGIAERVGKPRADMPWVEQEYDDEFIAYIQNFHTQQRPHILALLDAQTDKEIHIFKTRQQADAFLQQCT